jgi:hypothetical protein
VQTKDGIDELYRLLIAKQRRSDICVFSLAKDSEDPSTASASAVAVHNKTLGAAHIVVLSGPATFMLTDVVGKEFSVFDRAVRTYRPGFDLDSDDPFRHPIAMSHRIANWRDDSLEGPEAFEAFLSRVVILQTVSSTSGIEILQPPFSDVRGIATTASIRKASLRSASRRELLDLYENENVKLRAELTEQKTLYGGLLDDAERERDEAQRRFEEERSEVYRLKSRMRHLEEQLSTKATDVGIPDDLSSKIGLIGTSQAKSSSTRGLCVALRSPTTKIHVWCTKPFSCYATSISGCGQREARNLRRPTKPS